MGKVTEKFIGESQMKEVPKKKIAFKLKDGTVTSSTLADNAVVNGKIAEEAVEWKNCDANLQNIIATRGEGVIALSTEFGTSDLVGITQKTLTESKNSLQSQITDFTTSQEAINNSVSAALANRYTKDQTYNKSELNNLITTPAQEFVTVAATDQTTDVTDLLPAEGSADTVYRVANWDGTQYDTDCYSEYAWDGSDYVPLDVKDYGMPVLFTEQNATTAEKAQARENIGINTATSEDCQSGVYSTSTYSIGDIYINPAVTAASSYVCQGFLLRANASVTICGRNSGASSVLYVVTDKNTGEILAKAASGLDVREDPVTLTFSVDTIIYISAYKENSFAITFSHSIEVINPESMLEYAIVIGIPTLDTTTKTFTLPAGTLLTYRGITTTLAENLSITNENVWNSHYVVYSRDTLNLKLIPSYNVVNLPETYVPVALIRWTDGIYEGLFSTYTLNGNKVYMLPNTVLASLETMLGKMTGIYASELQQGHYYNIENCVEDTDISDFVGKTMEHEPTYLYIEGGTFWGCKFVAQKGSQVVISGHGGSGTSRLYMGVNLDTNKITYVADSGVDTTLSPIKIDIEADTIFYVTFRNINDSIFNVYKLDSQASTNTPKLFNPPLDLKKTELRILDIGNSYTLDTTHYLGNIISNVGITSDDLKSIALVRAYRASGSFKTWVDCYHNQDTEDYLIHSFNSWGTLEVDITGSHGALDGTQFKNVLKNNTFDLVIIHQASTYSTDYSIWEGTSEGGYLKELIRIIRANQPQASIGTYLIHSQWDGYSGNLEHDSFERWKKIADATKQMQVNYGIDFIIPYGTAIENLRASSLNVLDGGGESTVYDFCNDGTHLASGLGDYTASACYFQSIYGFRYGKSILKANLAITVPVDEKEVTYPEAVIDVDASNCIIANMAAFNACCDMYKVVNPDTISI